MSELQELLGLARSQAKIAEDKAQATCKIDL